MLVDRIRWLRDSSNIITSIESKITYPMIGKPVDDGCSSYIKKINDRQDLEFYIDHILKSEMLGLKQMIL